MRARRDRLRSTAIFRAFVVLPRVYSSSTFRLVFARSSVIFCCSRVCSAAAMRSSMSSLATMSADVLAGLAAMRIVQLLFGGSRPRQSRFGPLDG